MKPSYALLLSLLLATTACTKTSNSTPVFQVRLNGTIYSFLDPMPVTNFLIGFGISIGSVIDDGLLSGSDSAWFRGFLREKFVV